MHYFKFNIKSYRADTAHLSNAEDLAYRRAIEYYYDTESPLPNDNPALSRRLRVGEPELIQILQEFFVLTENGWTHSFCDSEIAEYRAFIEKQKNNGIKGGRPKLVDKKPTALPEEPSANPTTNHKPITNNQEPDTSTSPPDARDPQKFQMHVNWKPSEEFPTLAKMSMVKLQDGKLGEFVAHWLTRPDQRTQAEWDKALLQSILHDKARAQSPPRIPQRENFEQKDYGKGGRL